MLSQRRERNTKAFPRTIEGKGIVTHWERLESPAEFSDELETKQQAQVVRKVKKDTETVLLIPRSPVFRCGRPFVHASPKKKWRARSFKHPCKFSNQTCRRTRSTTFRSRGESPRLFCKCISGPSTSCSQGVPRSAHSGMWT